MEQEKITFDYLFDRGYIPTYVVGSAAVIYNKWGLELQILENFAYCIARIPRELIPKLNPSIILDSGYRMPSIRQKWELLEIERLMEIDQTPKITDMTVDELKALIPDGYTYILNKRKKKIESKTNLSFNPKRGRYKITKDDTVVEEGYNDEEERYFLSRSLLFILKEENKLIKNKI